MSVVQMILLVKDNWHNQLLLKLAEIDGKICNSRRRSRVEIVNGPGMILPSEILELLIMMSLRHWPLLS